MLADAVCYVLWDCVEGAKWDFAAHPALDFQEQVTLGNAFLFQADAGEGADLTEGVLSW